MIGGISLVTTGRMQHCFRLLNDIYHVFLLLFHCCMPLEIKLTTATWSWHIPVGWTMCFLLMTLILILCCCPYFLSCIYLKSLWFIVWNVRKRIRVMCKKTLTGNFDIVTLNLDLANSKFRHINSKFRLSNSKFRHSNSKFRHNNSKFRLSNSKFRLS